VGFPGEDSLSQLLTDLSDDEAHEQVANLNVTFSQYGQREAADRLEVQLPVGVEAATWTAAGTLDYWVKQEGEWWGRIRRPDGASRGSGRLNSGGPPRLLIVRHGMGQAVHRLLGRGLFCC
jgi:hypothetical protein